MPAVSKAKRQAAGIALSAKRGKIHPSKLQGASAEMYNSMQDSDLEDFASTEDRRLPDRVKEEKLREYIKKYIKEIIEETKLNEDESINESGLISKFTIDDMRGRGFDGTSNLVNKINEIIEVVNEMQGIA